MCITKSESQTGVERRRVLRLGTKGGDEDRGRGVEGKAGEEGGEGGRGDMVGLSCKGGMGRGEEME